MDSRAPLTINICSVPVTGVGAIGMAAVVFAMVIEIPAARWLFLGSALAGAVAAAIVIRLRREHVIGTPGDDLPMCLGLHDAGEQTTTPATTTGDARRGVPRLAVGY